MSIRISFLLAFIFGFQCLNAQMQHNCGVDHGMDLENKLRMQRNRDLYSNSDLAAIRAQRNTIYIPTTIHICGSTTGSGFASPSNAFKMLCRLNADFADQNIQFYLNDIRFIQNDAIYADAYAWSSMGQMSSYKVANNLNIFTNAQVSRSVAGYYTPSYDFVFIHNGSVNGISTTITHEVGHFLTLPHTFYGWEGENAVADYTNTPAPTTINGNPVELVARTNCLLAGDGFCDTDADYISFRFSCPISLLVQDPTGVVITPNPSFFMSYSSDACMAIFSQEQKNAMLADIIARGWANLPGPTNSDTLDASSISAVYPLHFDTITTNSGSTIEFEWDTVGASGAGNWIFLLERTIQGQPVGNAFQSFVSGTNKVNVPINSLQSNNNYRWSVHPYSDGYTCADKSNYFRFTTKTVTGTALNEPDEALQLEIFPNPNSSGTLSLHVRVLEETTANIQIYALDGRLMCQVPNLLLKAGSENLNLDISMFGTGLYFVLLHTEKGIIRQKLIINNQ